MSGRQYVGFRPGLGYTVSVTELPVMPGLDALTGAIDPVTARFVDAGYRLYLVGGVVRDLLLAGSGPFDPAANDIDLTTNAEPKEIKRLVAPIASAIWAQGERFGTIGAKVGPHALEITTHRAEAYDPESRKPVVSFGENLSEDLSRRDFTVNAAAIELPTGLLHDPFDGRVDLDARLLRTPLSPSVSFGDDPLRMMRAARFIARFGLDPSPELIEAATELALRLEIVSVERVSVELDRLLITANPAPGLEFLERTGLLRHIILELFTSSVDSAGREQAIALAAMPGTGRVRLGGLLWPVRDQVGQIMRRLKYSRAAGTATARLVEAVEQGTGDNANDGTVRRIAERVGPQRLDEVCSLAMNVAPYLRSGNAQRLVDSIEQLQRSEDLSDLSSPLSGSEIMELLQIEAGPDVGRAQRFLRDVRLDTGPLSVDEARRAVVAWWAEQRGSL
jgi:poly(A) polymerase